MFLLAVFIFAVLPGSVHRGVEGKLTTIGRNAVMHVGSNANITCTTNNLETLIDWEYHSPNGKVVVYQNGRETHALKDKFHVYADQRAGRSDLVIKNITLTDAGTYRCYESADSRHRMDTELIIISLHRFCVIDEYDGNAAMEVSCTVFYRGSIRPTIDCEPSEGDAIRIPRDNRISYQELFSTNHLAVTCWLHFNVSGMPVFNWTRIQNQDFRETAKTAADAQYTPVPMETMQPNSSTRIITPQYSYIVIVSSLVCVFLLVACITAVCAVRYCITKRRQNDLAAQSEVPLSDIPETANVMQDFDEMAAMADERDIPGATPDDLRLSDGSSYEDVSAALSATAESLPVHDQVTEFEPRLDDIRLNAAADKRYLRLDPTTRVVAPPPVYTRLAGETQQVPFDQSEITNQPTAATASDSDGISSSAEIVVRNDKPYVRLDPGTRVVSPPPPVYARLA